MKGILPVSCRVAGYALLILLVFTPMLLYMFGYVDDSNLFYIKSGVKLGIWACLFMILLARTKDECEKTAQIRGKSLQYALFLWGIYYLFVQVSAMWKGGVQTTDDSTSIVYLILCVLCFEFLSKKHRIEQQFKKRG